MTGALTANHAATIAIERACPSVPLKPHVKLALKEEEQRAAAAAALLPCCSFIA